MSYDLYNSLGSKGQPLVHFFPDPPETSPQGNMAWASKIPAFFGISLSIVGGFGCSYSDHVPWFISHPASEEEL